MPLSPIAALMMSLARNPNNYRYATCTFNDTISSPVIGRIDFRQFVSYSYSVLKFRTLYRIHLFWLEFWLHLFEKKKKKKKKKKKILGGMANIVQLYVCTVCIRPFCQKVHMRNLRIIAAYEYQRKAKQLFDLEFYGPVNTAEVMSSRSLNLLTLTSTLCTHFLR